VRVANFELSNVVLPDANFTLNCSKGTYVRTIIHDLGEKIGCGGHLTALRRTAIDRFRVEESNSLEVLKELPHAELVAQLIPSYQAVPSNLLS